MISRTKKSFWRYFASLDPALRTMAEEAYAKFDRDPGHPSLHFKKLKGHKAIWTARLSDDFRTAGIRKGDTIVWFWIGPHKEFDRLFV